MTRILHTGDTHLGYQQYHLPERREDFLDAFRQVARDAESEAVDAVVHAGDLFHDRQPRLSDIMGALSVLRDLDDAGVPFLAVVGNHEGRRSRQWLDLFESMGLATRLGSEPVTVGNTAIYGLDFVPRSQREDLDYAFDPHDAEYAALVSHGLFAPFEHGDWDARKILRQSSVDFDAVLLGDDHEAKTKQLDAPTETWLTYCGSTERASASEREARGYNLVSFDDRVDIRRRGLDTRAFVFVDVDLGSGEGGGRVRERIDEYDVTGKVVVVTLTGEGETVMAADIEAYGDEHGALTTRVNDRREHDEETDVEVSFADPDEAVQQRVREMGLSPAARDLDETIRASKVADSNVADEVQRRVAAFVDEADPGAFEAAEDGDEPAGDETPADAGDDTETAASEPENEQDGEAAVSEPENEQDGEAADSQQESEQDGEAAGSEQDTETAGSEQDGDQSQVTMEDYL